MRTNWGYTHRFIGLLVVLFGLGSWTACSDTQGGKLDTSDWYMEVRVEPDRATYMMGERVFINARVYTGDGSVVGDPPFRWEVDGGNELEDGVVELSSYQGLTEVTICVDYEDADLCERLELAVDASPPELEVTRPQPAEEVLLTEDGMLVVEGTAVDSNPEARVSVYANGVRGDVASDGSFRIEIPADFGIQHLVVQASDGFHKPVVERLDVLTAYDYRPPVAGTTRVEFEDAVVLRLTQKFFDRLLGGSDLDLDLVPFEARDLATMLEYVVLHLDLQSVFGDAPVLEVDDIVELNVEDVTVGDAIIDIRLAPDQQIELSLTINEVFVETSGWLNILDMGFDMQGGIAADLRGSIMLQLILEEDGTISSQVDLVDVAIAHLSPRFEGNDGEFFNALIDLGTVQRTFRELVEEALEGPMVQDVLDTVPTMLTDLLNSVTDQLNDLGMIVETDGMFPVVELVLQASLGRLDIEPGASDGYIDFTLDAEVEVLSDTGPVHSDSLGVAQDIANPEIPLDVVGSAQLVLLQDFINGLLHSMWNAGFLEKEPDGNLAFELSAKMPPVFSIAPNHTDCLIEEERCDALLQLGQLEVSSESFSIYVYLEAGVSLELQDNALTLRVVDTPVTHFWGATGSSGEKTLLTLIPGIFDTMVWNKISEVLGEEGELVVPIPIPSFAELGLDEYTHGLEEAVLSLDALRGLRSESGYFGLGVDLLFQVFGD